MTAETDTVGWYEHEAGIREAAASPSPPLDGGECHAAIDLLLEVIDKLRGLHKPPSKGWLRAQRTIAETLSEATHDTVADDDATIDELRESLIRTRLAAAMEHMVSPVRGYCFDMDQLPTGAIRIVLATPTGDREEMRMAALDVLTALQLSLNQVSREAEAAQHEPEAQP